MIAEIHRLAPSLHREVRRAGGSLNADQAARRLLQVRGEVGAAGRKVILALARSDARLEVDAGGMLTLAPAASPDLTLEEAEFVVVDVETTGTRPGAARITELGAVRVQAGRPGETFHRLVDPGLPLPAAVTRLTGIDAALLQGAPPFARIAVDWLDFAGGGVLVAHNAPFDTHFLTHELVRCGEEPMRNPVLCSVRLARRLIPALRSHSLDALARHCGLTFRQRHRALSDAEVTAQALIHLLGLAEARGARTIGDLLRLIEGPVPLDGAAGDGAAEPG